MAVQNLVSAALDAEGKAEISESLGRIKQRLNFLLTLQPAEIRGLFKAANGFMPFIEKAYNAANAHPEILPTAFNIEEFKKDFTLVKELTPIFNEINELADSLQNTLMALNSDALAEALDIYGAVKLNRDKVPGLNVVVDEMSVFFRKAKRAAAAPAAPVSNQ